MIKLFSDIFITKGYNRSVLQDLSRNEYYFIPNLLAKIILKYDGKIEHFDIQEKSHSKYAELFKEYYSFLDENEFIFDIDKRFVDNFPQINKTYEYPFNIINISIFFSRKNIKAIKKAFENNVFYNVVNLHFFISDHISFQEIENLLSIIFSKSTISIQIEIGKDHKDIDKFNELQTNNQFIKVIAHNINISIDFFDSKEYKEKYPFLLNHYIQYYEATEFNTYYNKRLYIDQDGFIKLNPKYNLVLGDIYSLRTDNDLNTIAENKQYKDICSIHRGIIEICKDCELRMMCIDDKMPIKKENHWFLENECIYNPFISKWQGEDGYLPVKEIGIYTEKTGFLPDKTKIAILNQQIWGESDG